MTKNTPITPKFSRGSMFSMEPDSRMIIISVNNELKSYRLAHVVQDKIVDSPDTEFWSFDKLDELIARKKVTYMCNIFDIVPISVLYLF